MIRRKIWCLPHWIFLRTKWGYLILNKQIKTRPRDVDGTHEAALKYCYLLRVDLKVLITWKKKGNCVVTMLTRHMWWSSHRITNIESLHYMPETCMMLYVHCIFKNIVLLLFLRRSGNRQPLAGVLALPLTCGVTDRSLFFLALCDSY